jgi:hypothetical protein
MTQSGHPGSIRRANGAAHFVAMVVLMPRGGGEVTLGFSPKIERY